MTKDYSSLTKDQLIEMLNKQNEQLDKVKEAAGGRKAQVLKVLRKEGHISVAAIAERIGISARNVSSQLTYLRKEGLAIATDSLGRKFIESEPEAQEDVKPDEPEKPEETEKTEKPKTVLRKKADKDKKSA